MTSLIRASPSSRLTKELVSSTAISAPAAAVRRTEAISASASGAFPPGISTYAVDATGTAAASFTQAVIFSRSSSVSRSISLDRHTANKPAAPLSRYHPVSARSPS